jgi:hypothetical protein
MAYRNDYVGVRGQSRLAEDAWRRNKCHETPPAPAKMTAPVAQAKMPAPVAGAKKGARQRPGDNVY